MVEVRKLGRAKSDTNLQDARDLFKCTLGGLPELYWEVCYGWFLLCKDILCLSEEQRQQG